MQVRSGLPLWRLGARVWAGLSQSGLASAASLEPPLSRVFAGEGPYMDPVDLSDPVLVGNACRVSLALGNM